MKITNEKQFYGGELNGWVVESHPRIATRKWSFESAYTKKSEALDEKKRLRRQNIRNTFNMRHKYRIRKVRFLSMSENLELRQVISRVKHPEVNVPMIGEPESRTQQVGIRRIS